MPLPWNLEIDPITGVLSGTPRTAPGTFNFTVKATNINGSVEKSFTMTLEDSDINPYLCLQNLGVLRSFMLDYPMGEPDYINNSRPLITLKGNGGLSRYNIYIDGILLPDIYYCNMYGSVGIRPLPLADGVHKIEGIELNPQPGAVCIPYSFTVDTVPTVPPVITLWNQYKIAGTAPADAVSVHVLDGAYLAGGSDVNVGAWSVTLQTLKSGTHIFKAVAIDRAGNQSGDSNVVTVTVP